MSKTTLQTYTKKYTKYLPFVYNIIFKRQGIFNEMIVEASKKFPHVADLTCNGIGPNIVSFVYKPEHSNHIYLFATDELSLDILVHETAHVVMRIFEGIGSEMNESTEEFFAYLQEMIFRDTMEVLYKQFEFTPVLTLS